MKKLFIIFLFFSCCLITLTDNQYTKNSTPSPEEVIATQKNQIPSILKNHIVRFTFAGILIYNKDGLINMIKNHPYITTIFVGLFSKYIYDSNQKHNDVKNDLNALQMIQELYDLILYAIEISNIMIKISSSTRSFVPHEHFNQIVQEVPYSFDELEKMTQQILIKWKLKVKHKYPDLYIPIRSPYRVASHIKDVNDEVYYFYKDPVNRYNQTCIHIAKKIKVVLQNIIKLKIIDS